MGNLGVPELLIIAGVIILLFGARKLPEMARSLGKSAKAFKEETKGMRGADDKDEKDDGTPSAPSAQSATQQQLPEAQPQTPAQTNTGQASEGTATGAQTNGAQPVEQAQQNKNAG